jgi:molybdopterin-guanine dinucleotide biosynthesis protein A
MGRDKALLPDPYGVPLLERLVERLGEVVDEVIVAGGPEGVAGPHRQVADPISQAGPLAGMLAGLGAAPAGHAWVLGCDFPEANPRVGRLLFDEIGGFDAAVPRTDRAQGLYAVYSTNLAGRIRMLLEAGRRSVRSLLDISQVRYLDPERLAEADPGLGSFLNLNTEKDYLDWLIRARSTPAGRGAGPGQK